MARRGQKRLALGLRGSGAGIHSRPIAQECSYHWTRCCRCRFIVVVIIVVVFLRYLHHRHTLVQRLPTVRVSTTRHAVSTERSSSYSRATTAASLCINNQERCIDGTIIVILSCNDCRQFVYQQPGTLYRRESVLASPDLRFSTTRKYSGAIYHAGTLSLTKKSA
jgi:hypothetical protein